MRALLKRGVPEIPSLQRGLLIGARLTRCPEVKEAWSLPPWCYLRASELCVVPSTACPVQACSPCHPSLSKATWDDKEARGPLLVWCVLPVGRLHEIPSDITGWEEPCGDKRWRECEATISLGDRRREEEVKSQKGDREVVENPRS